MDRKDKQAPILHTWEPIKSDGSLSEQIAKQIEEVIVSRDLQPGDRLAPERQLAEAFNVSRASLREALRILAARGRIRIEHGRGIFVAPHQIRQDLQDAMADEVAGLTELYAMREVLEVPACRWAAERADEEAIERLYEILNLCDALPVDAPVDEYRELDFALHRAIVEIAGNRFLQQSLGVLQDLLTRGQKATVKVDGRVRVSRIEHGDIIRAIAAGDPEAAEEAMRAHLGNTKHRAVRRLEAVSQK